MQGDNGVCQKLECGGDTFAAPLALCPDGLLNERIAANVDRENDGCVDPFTPNGSGACGASNGVTDQTVPGLELSLIHI